MTQPLKWIGGTVLAAVVAFALLVPKSTGENDLSDERRARLRGWREYSAARDTARAVNELLRRAETRAIAAALPPVSSEAPLIRIDPKVPAGIAASIRDAFTREWRGAATSPRHPVALVVTADTVERGSWGTVTIALPRTPEAPCAVVFAVSLPRVRDVNARRVPRLLGTCGFYLAYGTPGAEVSTWLRATRLASARSTQAPPRIADDRDRLDLDLRFMNYSGFSAGSIPVTSCRAGRLSACSDLLSPDPRALPPLEERRPALWDELASYEPGTEVHYSIRWDDGSNYDVQGPLLAALAQEMGTERFGETWRGPKSLEESYQAAAGRPLVSWIEEYVASRTLPYAAGPGTSALATALAVALILLALLVAVRFTPRRVS